ncbi:MAG: glycosyltransferase [Anaerolineae bacterium]|nr:glycosyltransferase [Gemmatimonadaceae bacterium]
MNTILHMIDTGGIGGAETVYLNLIRDLDHSRWCHVAVVPTRGWLYEQLASYGIKPVLISERNSFDVGYFAQLAAIIHRHRVTIIQAHLFGSAVRAALLALVCRVPAIATLHGTIDLPSNERFRRLKVAAVNHGLQRIVFVSELLRQSFLAAIPIQPDRTTVILNGIDPRRPLPGSGMRFRQEFGISPNEFVIGTIGNPGPAKGFDVLLDAAAIVKNKSPGCRFIVVGELDHGRGAELIKNRETRGLTEDVVLTGYRNDIPRALAAFDMYALTSRTEGLPLSLLEAMAAELPVVATRCGGPEEVIDDGVSGLLVANGSAEAIASSIVRLRADAHERRRLAKAARQVVESRFGLERQVQSYGQLYRDCLTNAGRGQMYL